jgi:uncharacterized protein (DUF1684 family)
MADLDAADPAAHRAVVEKERAEREARLRDPLGWLSLVGLHWLHPGAQRFGSSPSNEIVLRAGLGDVAAVAGSLDVIDDRVLVSPEPGAGLMLRGRPVEDGTELLDDEAETPTVLELASLRLILIRRGAGRLALRVKDAAAPTLRSFDGLRYFEIDPRWRVTGRLVRGDPNATIPIPDVLGTVSAEHTPGTVEFEIDGRRCRLDALDAMPGHLALLFGDLTNGQETYGGGRFLISGPIQPDDSVEIDFNLAYDPPCVFTPYATCPLPPLSNRLPVRIEAGEMGWRSARIDDPAGRALGHRAATSARGRTDGEETDR